ncbi:hypothetical protein Sta7437_0938 [Stanieria cyanosphaera PCC 7437]|uniref:Uncharacterized protein n=1 Tax=Stanieria cyanosphaera (strain ATCC 29371 / PCC 7437) TaxID=111780 RepID=K9XPH6_STAC7|nr:hypothetical protein [Stanieria cyanosphaera]AFZ34520.1 hypothetical protein Sta7437_0938 [Stanieria cyanosphaera PCC 7437]
MKRNNLNTQSNTHSHLVSAQARRLMQQNRQKQHNRIQSMGQRTASELGIEL